MIERQDLKNFVNICKKYTFDQIEAMFNDIDNVYSNPTLENSECASMVNIQNEFGENVINETKSIYDKYYDMKGGTSSHTRRKLQDERKEKAAAKAAENAKYVHTKNNTSSPKKKYSSPKKVDPEEPKTGFFSRTLESLKDKSRLSDKNVPVNDEYLDLKRSELVRINKGISLSKYSEEKYKRMTKLQLDKFIENNLHVSIDDIEKNKNRLMKLITGLTGEQLVFKLQTILLKDLDKFIEDYSPITDKNVKDNKKDLEYIFGEVTDDIVTDLKKLPLIYLNNMVQNKEKAKENYENSKKK